METYFKFIESCKQKTPLLAHRHHIIPKCMGGNDDLDNIIYLSYEDHQTAHILLAESFPTDSEEYKKNMLSAQFLNSWTNNPDVLLNGWKHTDESKMKMKGVVNREGDKNPFYQKSHKKESKNSISKSLKGNKNSLGKSKYYDIYDNGILIGTVFGHKELRDFCIKNNLPYSTVLRSKKSFLLVRI